MNVCIENMGDLHALLQGYGKVVLHITFGIDNGHGLGPWAADHVGKAAQAGHGDLVEIHVHLLFAINRAPDRAGPGTVAPLLVFGYSQSISSSTEV